MVGRDIKTDLALLKVTPKKPLPATHFGDSDKARIGDWVIAIGDPFGLGSTVTAGIVSARNRDINAGPYDDFIQTDAPINRGNSGGPLFDMDGNVIGINSAIFSPSGGSVGIGFSIPSNLAREVVAQLRQFGVARRGWIGVRIQQVTHGDRRRPGPSHHPGRAGGRRHRRTGRPPRRAWSTAIWSPALTASRSPIRPRPAAHRGRHADRQDRQHRCAAQGPQADLAHHGAKLDEDADRPTSRARPLPPPPKNQLQAVAAGPVAGRCWTAPRAPSSRSPAASGRGGDAMSIPAAPRPTRISGPAM